MILARVTRTVKRDAKPPTASTLKGVRPSSCQTRRTGRWSLNRTLHPRAFPASCPSQSVECSRSLAPKVRSTGNRSRHRTRHRNRLNHHSQTLQREQGRQPRGWPELDAFSLFNFSEDRTRPAPCSVCGRPPPWKSRARGLIPGKLGAKGDKVQPAFVQAADQFCCRTANTLRGRFLRQDGPDGGGTGTPISTVVMNPRRTGSAGDRARCVGCGRDDPSTRTAN